MLLQDSIREYVLCYHTIECAQDTVPSFRLGVQPVWSQVGTKDRPRAEKVPGLQKSVLEPPQKGRRADGAMTWRARTILGIDRLGARSAFGFTTSDTGLRPRSSTPSESGEQEASSSRLGARLTTGASSGSAPPIVSAAVDRYPPGALPTGGRVQSLDPICLLWPHPKVPLQIRSSEPPRRCVRPLRGGRPGGSRCRSQGFAREPPGPGAGKRFGIDPRWLSAPTVDVLVVVSGALRVEIEKRNHRARVLRQGDVLILPPGTRCRP